MGISVNGKTGADPETCACRTELQSHRRSLYILFAAAMVVMSGVVFAVTFFSMQCATAPFMIAESAPPSTPEMSRDLAIITKEEWHGAEAKYVKQLRHPTPFVEISHTASPACYSPVKCSDQMRNIQDYHMSTEIGLPDIGYSFVVGGDGNVYEGRGWDATTMHNGFVKRCNIGISLIGNFGHDTPTNGQLEAVKDLIELGVKLGKIDENYKLVPMNETIDTLSPGSVLYGIIKEWPHFWTPSKNDVGACPYTV